MISVVVTTWNRPALLRQALESLIDQSLDPNGYEIIVVDDGSLTDVSTVVKKYRKHSPALSYCRQSHSGLAAAKNRGMELCSYDLVLFFDDDDVADHDLLAQHLETHHLYPEFEYAVLGFTSWSPRLDKTPLMTYLTEVGQILFSYGSISHGEWLYYWHFWGGRTSMKRSFLKEHGRFDPVFSFGCEDIELGYRLHPHGLRVQYNARAVSWMNRSLQLREACQRQARMSRAQWRFYQLHPEEPVRNWVNPEHCEEHWQHCAPLFDGKLKSAEALENKLMKGPPPEEESLRELYILYGWLFKAASYKGLSEACAIG